MSLRLRIVVGLVALVAVGLAVAALVTYTLVGRFLLDRVDQQLAEAQQPVQHALVESLGPGSRDPLALPPGTYGELRHGDQVVTSVASTSIDQTTTLPPPQLGAGLSTGFSSVSSSGDGPRYRVEVSPSNLRFTDGSTATLVVAVPLSDVDQTLSQLSRVELLVALVVLAAVAVLGWWVVQLGLAPLRRMGQTADAIADGDLSRRVEDADPRTEVGRLGHSFNTMVGRIESAFAATTASEERMRRFLADASHELRTPLTSIRGYSELFRRGAGARPEDVGRAMHRIESESERMSVLVEELLTLARLDEGRPTVREPVDLGRLAEEGAEDMRAADPGRPVTVRAEPGVVIPADEHQLRQVVGNLLANARAHTPPGTPVWVDVSRTDDHAVLEVADGGPGIPPEDLAHVFDRFYRVDQARTRASGGAGLGLSIVAAVVAAHDGRVAVRNDPGGGARFRLELPLVGSAVPVDSQPNPSPLPASRPTMGASTATGRAGVAVPREEA